MVSVLPATPKPSELGPSTSARVDEIRKRMRLVRREIKGQVQEVVVQARQLTDWRAYVAAAPWTTFGVAMLVGYLLVPRRPLVRADRKTMERFAEQQQAAMERVAAQQQPVREKSPVRPTSLAAKAFAAVTDFVTQAGLAYAKQMVLQQFHFPMTGATPQPAPQPEAPRPQGPVRPR